MNAYFLFQYGNDETNRMILEHPTEAEIEKMKRAGWVILNINYKIGKL